MERTGLLWFAWAILAGVGAPAQAPASEIVLHNFGSPQKGANPFAGVIRDSAGNLYGTTYYGGAANQGAVYKLDTTGHLTVLHSFKGGADGANPYAGVVRDAAGSLYGTTRNGGPENAGVVYKLDTAGHETVFYAFMGGAYGSKPNGVILDSAGNLYGTTEAAGTAGRGLVYKLDTAGHQTVLYTFTGFADGNYPVGELIRDSAGNLYGVTGEGGSTGFGVVYRLDTTGHETVLYSFTYGANGYSPYAGVILDSAGNLYGTTQYGGTAGHGVVYKLDSTGQQTVLYSFTGGADGGRPYAGVILDLAGNLYGTTQEGGTADLGVVYKLDAAGHETVLHSFAGRADGGTPYAGVILDSDGNLYGTAYDGGIADLGVVYGLDTAGHQTMRYSFKGGTDGAYPSAGVVFDPAGNLYGTTTRGGMRNLGVVYKLDIASSEIVLHSFTGGSDGAYPIAGVILDPAGNLYGTAPYGGLSHNGVVYKLDTVGQETVIDGFAGAAANPRAGVTRDSAGNLYGTTPRNGWGTVYKVDTTGQETVLYSFHGYDDGATPYAEVIRDAAGNLYGTTLNWGVNNRGVVYKLDIAGQETVLHTFTGPSGDSPYAGVILDSVGNLYGTTLYGGVMNRGVVYKLDTAGKQTVIYSFTGGRDGGYPYAGVVLDSAGNLYGTTTEGGTADRGVVYKLDTTGQQSVLHSFTGGADGDRPEAGVTLDSAGNLYGTTYRGGKRGTGVVFKITP